MSDTIKVRIESDYPVPGWKGPALATRITDATTGATIEGVARVVLDATNMPMATLYIYSPQIDMVVDATTVQICAQCKKPLNKREHRKHRALFRRKKRGQA
jgi:hypothetical protein